MDSNLQRRLREFIAYKHLPVSRFEKEIGATNGYVKGIGRSIGSTKLCSIFSKYPELSREWLLTGSGSMINTVGSLDEGAKIDENNIYLPLIPIDALAGFLSIDNAGVALSDCPQYAVPEFSARGAEFLVRVSGESMQPRYNSGDIIACRRLQDAAWIQWGKVYVLDTAQGMLVKHIFQSRRRGCIICHSVNTNNYPDFEVPMSDIRSVSIVVGTISLE